VTKIGFKAINFSYESHVNFLHPHVPINFGNSDGLAWEVQSVSATSNIFNSMVSNWQIKATSASSCLVDYNIKMEFASVLYSAITT
jgi:ribosome-associated toxin RatA of RatAB toxin-antitoxin module